MQRLVRALTSCVLLAASFVYAGAAVRAGASPVRAPAPLTLTEFARTRTHPPAQRFEPRAALAAGAETTALCRLGRAYLLYVSAIDPDGAGHVDVFLGSAKQHPLLGRITGLDDPSNLAVDAGGRLYVVQTDVDAPVLVFPFGAKKPSLALRTLGNVAVAVAVGPSGTVFVSTANANGRSAKILVYPPGASLPVRQFDNLAGDAVAALQTDDAGNVYYSRDFVGFGNDISELTTAGVKRSLLAFNDPVTGFQLDRAGNLVVLADGIGIYAHDSGRLLALLGSGFAQSLAIDPGERSLYAAAGVVSEYAYPSGTPLGAITALAGDETFGLATFPAPPHGRPW